MPGELVPGVPGSSLNVLHVRITTKCQKVCTLRCVHVMPVHYVSYVCMLFYVIYSHIFASYMLCLCYTRLRMLHVCVICAH